MNAQNAVCAFCSLTQDIKKAEFQAWKDTLRFGWSDLRIDSPKYVSGFLRELGCMSQTSVQNFSNTVVVANEQ